MSGLMQVFSHFSVWLSVLFPLTEGKALLDFSVSVEATA